MPTLTELLQGGLGAVSNYLLSQQGIDSARGVGNDAYNASIGFADNITEASRFKPFSIATRTGNASTTPTGGFSSSLSPEMQQLVDGLFAGGQASLYKGADLRQNQDRLMQLLAPSVDGATNDIYGKLREARTPELDRQRLALEERLFNQGRTGVRTNQFGGTPEQLAFEKAMLEQQSGDYLGARGQAVNERTATGQLLSQALGEGRTQQLQDVNIGRGLIQDSFMPEEMLMKALQISTPLSELNTRANLQGQITGSEMLREGMRGKLTGETIASNLQQIQMQSLVNALLGEGGQGGLFGGLFGEGGTFDLSNLFG